MGAAVYKVSTYV